jgi:hypothetical protein
MAIILTTVTSAEAERITGFSQVRQRDLRRHGYLPPVEGHARFDVFGIGYMMALRQCMDAGVMLHSAVPAAQAAAEQVGWRAARWVESWTGIEGIHGETWLDRRRILEGHLEEYMRVARGRAVPLPRKYLLFLKNGAVLTDNLHEVFEGRSASDPAITGLLHLFDLVALATVVAEGIGKPLFQLVPDMAEAEPVRIRRRPRREKEIA